MIIAVQGVQGTVQGTVQGLKPRRTRLVQGVQALTRARMRGALKIILNNNKFLKLLYTCARTPAHPAQSRRHAGLNPAHMPAHMPAHAAHLLFPIFF
jgi:hypothetical protein